MSKVNLKKIIFTIIIAFLFFPLIVISRIKWSLIRKNFINPLDYVIGSNKKFIRWGDGETNLLFGVSTIYDKATLKTSINLFKTLRKKDTFKGLPYSKMDKPFSYLFTRDGSFWILTWYFLPLMINSNEKFTDSFIFRDDSEFNKRDTKARLLELKEQFPLVAYVTSEKSNIIEMKKIMGENINILQDLSPESIKIEIFKMCKNNSKILVLFSLGAVSKVIISQLKNPNAICLDVGNIFK